MKKYILALFLIYLFPQVFSQEYALDKGSKMISGLGSFNNKGGDLFANYEGNRATSIMFMPSFDYFFSEKKSIGGTIEFSSLFQGTYRYFTIGIGPEFDYFIGKSESKNFPFFEGSIRYYHIGDANEPKSGLDGLLGFGIICPIGEHTGIVIKTQYHFLYLYNKEWEEYLSGNKIMLGIGIAGLLF